MKEEKIFNLIKTGLNKERLTDNEKSLMYSNISEKIKKINSVRFQEVVPSPYIADNSMSSLKLVINKTNNIRNMLIGALIAAILGGSVSYAAQTSLPGDVLYPVKVNVNEGVQDLLAVSPQAQAQLETEKIIKRLNEAKLLKEQGKLDSQKKDILAKEVASHIDTFQKEVKSLEDNGDTTEVENLKNNLGSAISNVDEASTAVVVNNTNTATSTAQTSNTTSTSTTTTATTTPSTQNNSTSTVIVNNLTATSTGSMGDDDGDSEDGDDDDFFNNIRNSINSVSGKSGEHISTQGEKSRTENSNRLNNSSSSFGERGEERSGENRNNLNENYKHTSSSNQGENQRGEREDD